MFLFVFNRKVLSDKGRVPRESSEKLQYVSRMLLSEMGISQFYLSSLFVFCIVYVLQEGALGQGSRAPRELREAAVREPHAAFGNGNLAMAQSRVLGNAHHVYFDVFPAHSHSLYIAVDSATGHQCTR